MTLWLCDKTTSSVFFLFTNVKKEENEELVRDLFTTALIRVIRRISLPSVGSTTLSVAIIS